MKKFPQVARAATPVVLALLLTGCTITNNTFPGMPGADLGRGTSSSPSARAEGEFNTSDSMFVMMMIPHHAQAIEMSELILAESDVDQAVLDLAQKIKDAQGAEIELMEGWLEGWGMPGARSTTGMSGMHGMMSGDDTSALEHADGPEAQRLFLEQVIEHHEGAIEMAQDVLDDGMNPDVRALARRIITSQTAEIATMRELLS